MRSPVYPDLEMKRVTRMGVEIEYCPKSGGVWLDKGELEKLLEIASSQNSKEEYYDDDNMPLKNDSYNQSDSSRNQQTKPKKESFLSEIFDIF